MTARRLTLIVSSLVALSSFGLASCTDPVSLYHSTEGGVIAGPRQAPPGQDAPYRTLAAVPPVFAPAAPGAQAQIEAQAHNGAAPADPAALAGLDLPTAPPPLPPGLHLPPPPAAPAPPAVPPQPPAPRLGPAIVLAFPAGDAVLPAAENAQLADIAAHRGGAHVIAGGFGDGASLSLALRRAQRVAAGLTAHGVAPADIRIVASAAGSGGFVQLVY